ncbi:membrane protein insertase YidC [Caenispirillum salinarum]|uniref:membrane protein insertase YidC n=1 Tax=Caenispirillum salinarum TaxID=859058 RepID=UPI00384DB24F
MSEQRNLILAIVASLVILLGFEFLWPKPDQPPVEQAQQTQTQAPGQSGDVPTPGADVPAPGAAPQAPGAAPGMTAPSSRDAALAQSNQRVRIDTPALKGSMNLVGARIDDLTLREYHVEPDESSPLIDLLSPAGSPNPYYAEFGWVAGGTGIDVPGSDTVWTTDAQTLSPGNPVTLTWQNPQGIEFQRVISINDKFMFRVEQTVTNTTDQPVTLYPYGLIARVGTPQTAGFYILHEGPLGVFNETLKEVDYDDLADDGTIEQTTTGGWIGITDKYWLTALAFDPGLETKARFAHRPASAGPSDRYQVDYLEPGMTIAAGQSASVTNNFFAGAKEVKLLDQYAEQYNIPNFDLAVDFGWFYFLTKPFFYVLNWLHGLVGNFGVAILVFTVFIKLAMFPLANKSYKAMSKMKKLQPKMKELQERFGDDRTRLNQEMMALYKREKANPVSGCLPIVVQIPVFFALYKVLFVTLEMRHAPFYGWINDLSAPDPTSIFNLFGLLPFTPPEFLMIGVLPLIMGITMFLQQKLNPAPPDPMQAKIMNMLPIVFTFLLAHFPAGLVLYWAWNNTLSIAQQWIIMRRAGAA